MTDGGGQWSLDEEFARYTFDREVWKEGATITIGTCIV